MKYTSMGSTPETSTKLYTQTSPRRIAKTDEKAQFRVEESHATRTLTAIELLEENWDGYGASTPSPEALRSTRLALLRVLSLGLYPDITPNTDGTISMEWEGVDFAAELQIGSKQFSMYVARDGSPTSYFKGEVKGGSEFGSGVEALSRAMNPGHALSKPRFRHV